MQSQRHIYPAEPPNGKMVPSPQQQRYYSRIRAAVQLMKSACALAGAVNGVSVVGRTAAAATRLLLIRREP